MRTKIKRIAKRLLPPSALRMLRRRRRVPSSGAPHAVTDAPSNRPSGTGPVGGAVNRLEGRLWIGYETAALALLSQLASDDGADSSDRIGARLALARWDMARGRCDVALDHLDRAAKEVGDSELEVTSLSLAADCLSRLGRGREALARLSPLLDRREADASTLIRVGSARSLAQVAREYGSGPFIEALNRLYIPARLASVARRDTTAPAVFDNLSSSASTHEPRESEALISVIVTAQNASDTIGAALDSLLAQSWTNMEVIVVDDSSVDGTVGVVRSVMARDPRVTLVERSTSEGPYSCRNAGVGAAAGAMVAVHGSNEWAHPQKLEVQAGALLGDPSLMAVGTHHVRIGSDFIHRPLGRRPGVALVGRNVCSSLLRRTVFDHVGLWDEVRGPADEEFLERVEATFGSDAVAWLEPGLPLSIVRDANSSSPDAVSDFRLRETESRYRDAFRWWHRSPAFRSALPYRPGSDPRPFAGPSAPLVEPSRAAQIALLAVGDLGEDSASLLMDMIDQHAGDVGLIHVPAYQSSSHTISPAFHSLMASGRAALLGGDTVVHCRTLLVGPTLLDSPRFDHLPTVTADEGILIHADVARTQSDLEIADLEVWADTSFRVIGYNESGLVGTPPWG